LKDFSQGKAKKARDLIFSCPGVAVLTDGTFVTTTYGHWTKGEPPYVVSVRFTLKEIDQMYSDEIH